MIWLHVWGTFVSLCLCLEPLWAAPCSALSARQQLCSISAMSEMSEMSERMEVGCRQDSIATVRMRAFPAARTWRDWGTAEGPDLGSLHA